MRHHTKIYLREMGYDQCDVILCELCEAVAVDIAHIQPRGMGGSKKLDVIENLMALCRSCHHRTEGNKQDKEMLRNVHAEKLKERKRYV